MKTPILENHVWHRTVPATWSARSGWRTDIPASIFATPQAQTASYQFHGGPAVLIGLAEMWQALRDAPRRLNGKIGPFYIDPVKQTVNGWRVAMRMFPAHPRDGGNDTRVS